MQDRCTTSVSIVIPTLNRPAPLARAMASVAAQELRDGGTIELVIVDNSPDANARLLVEGFDAIQPIAMRYVSAPRPGVATARNAGVAAASGDWIAFLDDDEEAGPNWLETMLGAARASGADAVFGPVKACSESGSPIEPLGRFFSRQFDYADRADITASAAYLGTNNSMFSRQACHSLPGPFDARLDGIGGEDSLFLRRLVEAGRRFAWASEAGITEWVPAPRLTWTYVNKRKFLSGQIRTFVNRMVDRPRWRDVLLWMVVGVVQCGIAGVGAAVLWPVSKQKARGLAATAWGGLGKVLWMNRFGPNLYGTGLVS